MGYPRPRDEPRRYLEGDDRSPEHRKGQGDRRFQLLNPAHPGHRRCDGCMAGAPLRPPSVVHTLMTGDDTGREPDRSAPVAPPGRPRRVLQEEQRALDGVQPAREQQYVARPAELRKALKNHLFSGGREDADGVPRGAGDRDKAQRDARTGAHCLGREARLLCHPEECYSL